MYRQKSAFERYTDALAKTGDKVLGYWYQRKMLLDDLLSEREIDRIADRVIERIHITADASEIIEAIDEIQKKLKEIGDK